MLRIIMGDLFFNGRSWYTFAWSLNYTFRPLGPLHWSIHFPPPFHMLNFILMTLRAYPLIIIDCSCKTGCHTSICFNNSKDDKWWYWMIAMMEHYRDHLRVARITPQANQREAGSCSLVALPTWLVKTIGSPVAHVFQRWHLATIV